MKFLDWDDTSSDRYPLKKRLWHAPAGLVFCILMFGTPQSLGRANSLPLGSCLLQSVTGSYHARGHADLDVQEMPQSRIKFELSILTNLSAPGGPNSPEVTGVVPLQHGKAVYRSGGGVLTMQFYKRKVVVSQRGSLPDIEGVHVGGTYVKHSRTPSFDN